MPSSITIARDDRELVRALAAVHRGTLGINYLVRHPQPLLACYTGDRLQDKSRSLAECFTDQGIGEVARFAAHVVDVVRHARPAAGVALYYTRLFRTELFARTVAQALRAQTAARVEEPAKLDELFADSASEMLALAEAGSATFVPFVEPLLAERAKGVAMTLEFLALIRAWFPVWVRAAPGARACAAALDPYLKQVTPGRIRLLFTHEHVLAAYLHANAPAGSPFEDPARCFLGTAAYLCVAGDGLWAVVDGSANSEVPRT